MKLLFRNKKMVALPTPRALLFDWDGTLADSAAVIKHCYDAATTAVGAPPISMEDVRFKQTRSGRDTFPTLFGEQWPVAREAYYKAFKDMHLTHIAPLQGCEDMLGRLRSTGLFMAVVSNKTGAYLRDEVAQFGWTSFFDAIVGAGDALRDKPDRAPLDHALLGTDILCGPDVWMIGDSNTDMLAAGHAGATGVLLRDVPPMDREFEGCPPDFYASSAADLTQLLESLGLLTKLG
jgi:phosphoglycolate phosphatase